MFADDGLTNMGALFFSESGITQKMTITVHSATKKSRVLVKWSVWELKSIWHPDEDIPFQN